MRFTLLMVLAAIQFSLNAQSTGFSKNARIYLVRHAEKLSGDDPLLTEAGNNRAGDLMRVLRHKKIRRIYVTGYKRTQQTGDSLRIQSGIDTVHYFSDTSGTDLMNKLLARGDTHGAILIIGHSNTIPAIIRKLGVSGHPADEIPTNEFDNLFLVRFKKGKPVLKKMKYGIASGHSAAMQ